MEHPPIQPDLDWDVDSLHDRWPMGPDNSYILGRLWEITAETTVQGASGRVLEVACGDATHVAKINLRGFPTFGLEPSPKMLALARDRIAELGAQVTLVRGIAEMLPFRNDSFDRVLCESAIDHFADPSAGLAEIARVLKPDGRLIIGVVNYGSATVRLSRSLYRAARRVGWIAPGRRMFWDSPVPHEHTFECTYPLLMDLGRRWFDLDYAYGISLGWAFPGWGPLLKRLPGPLTSGILIALDRVAYRAPRFADYLMSVWRLRKSGE